MSDQKKIRIVFGSVMKPVNEPRAYHRMATSLVRTGNYDVHIFGSDNSKSEDQNITFHGQKRVGRWSWSRIRGPWKFYNLLLQLKPDLIVCNTHENLLVTIWYKILFGVPVLYDVQENYLQNATKSRNFAPVIKHLVGFYIRCKEWFTRPFINHYILAEEVYLHECTFAKGKATVIRNKFIQPQGELPNSPTPSPGNIRFLYTGSISKEYGTFDAINFVSRIRENNPTIELVIAGYSASDKTLKRLFEEVKGKSWVRIIGAAKPVDHATIISEIKSASFGLVPYEANISTMYRMPTKLYEYVALKLPYLVSMNQLWSQFTENHDAGVVVNFKSAPSSTFIKELVSMTFYQGSNTEDVLWSSEEGLFVETIDNQRLSKLSK